MLNFFGIENGDRIAVSDTDDLAMNFFSLKSGGENKEKYQSGRQSHVAFLCNLLPRLHISCGVIQELHHGVQALVVQARHLPKHVRSF